MPTDGLKIAKSVKHPTIKPGKEKNSHGDEKFNFFNESSESFIIIFQNMANFH